MLGQGIVAVTITTVGWSYSYYCGSLVGGLIWLYWVWMVRDRPELHNRMTEKEKAYIESAIGSSVDKDMVRKRNQQETIRNLFNSLYLLHRNESPFGRF